MMVRLAAWVFINFYCVVGHTTCGNRIEAKTSYKSKNYWKIIFWLVFYVVVSKSVGGRTGH